MHNGAGLREDGHGRMCHTLPSQAHEGSEWSTPLLQERDCIARCEDTTSRLHQPGTLSTCMFGPCWTAACACDIPPLDHWATCQADRKRKSPQSPLLAPCQPPPISSRSLDPARSGPASTRLGYRITQLRRDPPAPQSDESTFSNLPRFISLLTCHSPSLPPSNPLHSRKMTVTIVPEHVVIGVLALQGAFIEHIHYLERYVSRSRHEGDV